MKFFSGKTLYISGLILLGIYLLFANYLFNVVLVTRKESVRVTIALPSPSKQILHEIEEVKEREVQWKEMVQISGWLLRKGAVAEKRDAYLVFDAPDQQLVFRIKRADINRPDLVKNLHLDGNVWNLGFSAFIPRYLLRENKYRLGFVIVDDSGRFFTQTHYRLIVQNDHFRLIRLDTNAN